MLCDASHVLRPCSLQEGACRWTMTWSYHSSCCCARWSSASSAVRQTFCSHFTVSVTMILCTVLHLSRLIMPVMSDSKEFIKNKRLGGQNQSRVSTRPSITSWCEVVRANVWYAYVTFSCCAKQNLSLWCSVSRTDVLFQSQSFSNPLNVIFLSLSLSQNQLSAKFRALPHEHLVATKAKSNPVPRSQRWICSFSKPCAKTTTVTQKRSEPTTPPTLQSW